MRVVLLSPHFDDAILSLGAAAGEWAREGHSVTVCTLFGGFPAPGWKETPAARERHAKWGFRNAAGAVARRKREDMAACRALGVAFYHLNHPDALYRAAYSARGLSGHTAPSDLRLLPVLARAVPPADLYCAPLGIGGHVDHLLAHELAARHLHAPVLYWEDVPYRAYAGADTARRRAWVGALATEVFVSSPGSVDRKVAAVGEYRSQLPHIFRTTGPWEGVVRETERGHIPVGNLEATGRVLTALERSYEESDVSVPVVR